MTLVTREAIELARTGEWSASTGPWKCTKSQLADAVRAYKSGNFRSPVLKRGHTDQRFAADVAATGDGEPALGVVKNLRLADGGNSLVGDVTLPEWLDEELPAIYPSRSIEADLGVETSDGKKYGLVMTGLALLGVTKPAIQSLSEIPVRPASEPMQYLAAMSLAASMPLSASWEEDLHPRKGGKFVKKGSGYANKTGDKTDQAPQVKALQHELIRLGYLSKSSGKNGGVDGLFGPVTEAAVKKWQQAAGNLATGRVTPSLLKTLQMARKSGDPAKQTAEMRTFFKKGRKKSKQASVFKKIKKAIDDAPAKLAKNAVGSIRGSAEEFVEGIDGSDLSVREILDDSVVYEDADGGLWISEWDEDGDGDPEFGELEPARVVYESIAAAESLQAERTLTDSDAKIKRGWGDLEQPGSSLGEQIVDITPEMREALGVDETADEAAILAAIQSLKDAPTPPAPETEKETTEKKIPAVETVQASADIEARLGAKFEAKLAASVSEFQTMNRTLADELAKVTGELATRKQAEAVTKRETLLASAVREGRITPADKDHYGQIYDTNATVAETLLASRAPGSAVPLTAIGHSEDSSVDTEAEALYKQMFGGSNA